MTRPWKDAATLIILARDATKSSKFDYKVLTFKRTAKSSFYANSLVFPGGAIDTNQDESPSWTSFLKHHKIPTESIRRQLGTQKPFIFDPQDGKIEREISLRLTAIRETFEELGIVLCSPASATSRSSPFTDYFHSKDLDIPFWQRKIHNSEATLMNFCDKFSLVPNILGLYEWTVWLTPTFYPKRFETAFFVVALNSIPPCYPESHEVQSYSWQTPEELLAAHKTKSVFLPPPQYFELHRFLNCKSIDEIAKFCKQVNGRSVPLILPKEYVLKDSLLLVYPGDDLYPEGELGFYENAHDVQKFVGKTYDELMSGCENFCRIEMKDYYASRLVCNVKDGLLPAVSEEAVGKL